KLSLLAERCFAEFAPDSATLVELFGIPEPLAGTVHARVKHKLGAQAIEDFRIDFEDGFGVRTEAAEDAADDSAAREVTAANALPPLLGIRIKSFHVETKARALRTLDHFLSQATLP